MTKTNKISPVTLFQGKQSLLIDREIEKIRETASIENSETSYMVFHLDTDPVEKMIETANIIPMYGGQKLLVARSAEALKSNDISKLNSYIEHPSPDSLLILISKEANKPKLKSNPNLSIKDFSKVSMVENKIQKEAEMLGLNISRKACSEIHKLIGDDFTAINNELIKLLNYFGKERSIDEKDINDFILKKDNENIFTLINAVVDRQLKPAIKALRSLENQGIEPLAITSTLSRRISQIWQAKELIDQHNSDLDIMKKMKISKGAVYYIKKQARNFSIRSLSEMINKLSRVDTELKSYSQNKYNLLSRLIIELCS